jgi:glycosyltransferase involved in cell wall biosynthesis
VKVVIVGDGDGLRHLRDAAGAHRERGILFTGEVPPTDVPALMAAFDVASLPQSVDGVGSFRYSTKLSEYVAAGLPVVTGELPLAYDLDDGWLWRLPGAAPWDERYVSALAALMDSLTRREVGRRQASVPANPDIFDPSRQRRQVASFIRDILRSLDEEVPAGS